MRVAITKSRLLLSVCVLIPSALARADLAATEAYTDVAVTMYDIRPTQTVQSKYQFDRALRSDPTDELVGSVTAGATRLVLPGDLDGTTASAAPTASFDIGDGNLLDGGSVTNWPSGRYTESTQSWADSGDAVSGNVSEVPLPASVLLAMLGLGIVGVGRIRFAPQA